MLFTNHANQLARRTSAGFSARTEDGCGLAGARASCLRPLRACLLALCTSAPLLWSSALVQAADRIEDRSAAPVTSEASGKGETRVAPLQETVESRAAAERLGALLSRVRSLQTRFRQVLFSADGQRMQSVEGTLLAQQPQRFRWETEPPLAQTMVTDGTEVWIHDPDLEQVTVQALDQQLSATPALLFGGKPEEIGRSFHISRPATPTAATTGLKTSDRDRGDPERFILVPRMADALFESLVLEFLAGVPTQMTLTDALGQTTLLRFVEPKLNVEIPAASFRFQIPEGADVIRQDAANAGQAG